MTLVFLRKDTLPRGRRWTAHLTDIVPAIHECHIRKLLAPGMKAFPGARQPSLCLRLEEPTLGVVPRRPVREKTTGLLTFFFLTAGRFPSFSHEWMRFPDARRRQSMEGRLAWLTRGPPRPRRAVLVRWI
jgi:hypothetical protein